MVPLLSTSSATCCDSVDVWRSADCLTCARRVIHERGPITQPSRSPGASVFENVPSDNVDSGSSERRLRAGAWSK